MKTDTSVLHEESVSWHGASYELPMALRMGFLGSPGEIQCDPMSDPMGAHGWDPIRNTHVFQWEPHGTSRWNTWDFP